MCKLKPGSKLLVRYIAQPGRHPVERVLWIFLCLTGFGLAFLFLAPSQWSWFHIWFEAFPHLLNEPPLSGLEKHMNDPTTTGLETTDFPIWNIDFPGVTICPNTKVEMYFLDNLLYWRHHLHKNQGENVFLKKSPIFNSWQRASSRQHWQIQVSLGQSCWRRQMPPWHWRSRWLSSDVV